MALQNTGMVIVETNQVPYETDILRTNMYKMADISVLCQTVLGTGLNNTTLIYGGTVSATSPPSLAVKVAACTIYQEEDYNATDYGVIPADSTQMYKQGINLEDVQISTPAPGSGTTYYLIQAKLLTSDVNIVNRPFYNSENPSQPIFEMVADTRVYTVDIAAKSSVTPNPSPDSGYIGLAYVTVAFGQSTVTSGNITPFPNAPYITESLTQKISQASADIRYVTKAAEQAGTYVYAADVGTVNVMQANFTPTIASLSTGSQLRVKAANSNTGAVTLTVNANSPVAVVKHEAGGNVPLVGGEIIANLTYIFQYNGTSFELLNPTISSLTGLFPVGGFMYYAAPTAPDGWLACDGSAVSRTTYAALFAKISTIWGSGDGSTTFNLPPNAASGETGYTLVAAGGTSTSYLGNTVGSFGGETAHVQLATELAAHSHGMVGSIQNYCDGGGNSTYNTTGGGIGASTTIVGSSDAFNIVQPSIVGLLCIKY